VQLTALHRFPLKSCRGDLVEEAVVEAWGLAGDRRWMLADENGDAVTARETPRMLLVHARLTPDGGLLVSAPELDDLHVAVPNGYEHVDVSLFHKPAFAAALADPAAHAWFEKALGKPVRLVYADEPARRPAEPSYAGPGVPMAFGDGFPLLLTTEASLAELNRLIAEGPRAAEGELSMTRFRTNLVVDGEVPWAEDGWLRFRVGEAYLRGVKGCARCAIPTTDHETAVRYKEPTATLARHRRWDGGVWFGVNLVPENPGVTIRVGDEVEVLETVDASDGPMR
jgi:uncharacterized protein